MNLVRRSLENKVPRLAGVSLVMVERNDVCRDFEAEVRRLFGDLDFRATIPPIGQVRGGQRAPADHL